MARLPLFALGSQGEDIEFIQLVLKAEPTGYYDHALAARVRGFQSVNGLTPTGAVDEATLHLIDEYAAKQRGVEES